MENMEHQFIDRLRSGDANSYEILVRNYGGRMLSVARRYLKSEADAQDCEQDAYIQAFRNIGKFEGRSTLETWLHRIVVNTALMKIRSLKRCPEEFIADNASLFDKNGMRNTVALKPAGRRIPPCSGASGATSSVEFCANDSPATNIDRQATATISAH